MDQDTREGTYILKYKNQANLEDAQIGIFVFIFYFFRWVSFGRLDGDVGW